MNSKKSALLSGVIAALIAVAVIAAASSLGALRSGQLSSTVQLGAASTTQQTTSGGSSKSGTLAVLLTDPPTVPTGVTAVYITYVNLEIHLKDAGNNSGWQVLNTKGEIDLMSVINVTQTISNANIQSGVFNALEFNVTSATVTYKGSNYTANLIYGHNSLYVPIPGGIQIQSGSTSVAVIDLTPDVLLLTNSTASNASYSFAFVPYAKGYTLPAQSMINLHLKVGGRDNIAKAPWWLAIEHDTHFEITGVSLTPSSLSITVQNTGNASVLFRVAALTTTTSASGGMVSYAKGSEIFSPESNATLDAITVWSKGQGVNEIAANGYLLAPNSSVTFTYSGNITLGLTWVLHQTLSGITPGDRYVVTISGNGQNAQTSVLASGA